MANTPFSENSSFIRFTQALLHFTFMSIALLMLIIGERIFEIIIISDKHALPVSYFQMFFPILFADLYFFLACSGILGMILLPLLYYSSVWGERAYYGILVLFGMIHFGLVQYFSITLIPLGVDFFGYTMDDIRITIKTSSGISVKTFLPYLILIAVIAAHLFLRKRIVIGQRTAIIFTSVSTAAFLLSLFYYPSPKEFSSEMGYNLSINKSHYFAAKAGSYFTSSSLSTEDLSAEYPLLRDFPYEDVLGPYLNTGPVPPNIVVVIVEGLGRDFVGAGARFGGFLPFLDSLTKQSLYWENFLSNSGRTFGVLPSLLGSLPYGSKGFNELEYNMPRHLSLIRLLKQNNYRVNFMYGGNKNFDKKDVFLERESTDLILDDTKFGPEYVKAPGDKSGFSWGYPDRDVFRKAMELIDGQRPGPRMDIYLTMSTHEPFIPPNRQYYHERFETILPALGLSTKQQSERRTYRDEFSSLIYLDDAMRFLIGAYSKRPDFQNTIIVITGDHRIIPIPAATKIDRFHVPLIIFSPLVKKPVTFSSVSSQLDFTPTMLAHLKTYYALRLPAQAHWIGNGIDTARQFRNVQSIPFMRVKEEIADYLDGRYFISGDQLFELNEKFDLEEIQNNEIYESVRSKLDRFRQINTYVIEKNKLYPGNAEFSDSDISPEDMEQFKRIDSMKLDMDQLYLLARKKAFEKETKEARLICRRILASAPNYHDVRILLGHTFAWNKEYETAKRMFNTVLERDPNYPDAYAALADVQLWNDSASVSLQIAQRGLSKHPKNEDLLLSSIKALLALNRKKEAAAQLKRLYQINPSNPEYENLKKKIAAL